jgi:sugar phosphate isomerase/epimerase
MDRRTFLNTTKAAMALPFLSLPDFAREVRMGIVVHSYAMRWHSKVSSEKYRGFENALDLLNHCHEIGAGGIQVTVRDWASDFSKKIRDRREKLGMFLEGSIMLPKTSDDAARFEADVKSAKEAGASIVRTVCLNGRRYENIQTLIEFEAFHKASIKSLQIAEPIMRKHKMTLAIENHKDWRANELVALLKEIDSEWIGATLDFGNNVALIEDPMEVVNTLAPFAASTHVKDMGVKAYENGFLLSEVPLGQGVLDLKTMFEKCKKHRPSIHFNLEMITRDPLKIPCQTEAFWATLPEVRGWELARTLRLVKDKSFPGELPTVSSLSDEQRLVQEERNVVASLEHSKSVLGLN